jgi:hypothetical protein
MPNKLLESINNRTSNATVKRKGTKEQTMTYTTPHRKLKIEQHEPRKHR